MSNSDVAHTVRAVAGNRNLGNARMKGLRDKKLGLALYSSLDQKFNSSSASAADLNVA